MTHMHSVKDENVAEMVELCRIDADREALVVENDLRRRYE